MMGDLIALNVENVDEAVKDNGFELYRYIRGSVAYGLATETSDIDEGGVYIANLNKICGLPNFYYSQIANKKNDIVIYELTRYMELLLKSNPTILESLFIADSCVKYIHPLFKPIIDNRQSFVTKQCFNAFCGYAKSQIEKCRGLNKKMIIGEVKQKTIDDFIYTFYFSRQGTRKIKSYLEENHLYQEFCGLAKAPNMRDNYIVFYDWMAHEEKHGRYGAVNCKDARIKRSYEIYCNKIDKCANYIPYRGIWSESAEFTTEVKLSNIAIDDEPICVISYDKDAFSHHLTNYREYNKWVEERNPERYKENCGKMYDRKNVAHAIRLMNMGIEIANDGAVNVDRTNIDRDFILSIRKGSMSYEEVIKYMNSKEDEMQKAMASSKIPEKIDVNLVNDLLVNIRNEFTFNLKNYD